MKRDREEEAAEPQDAGAGGSSGTAGAAVEDSPAKRAKLDAPPAAAAATAAADPAAAAAAAADDDNDKRILMPVSSTRSAVKKGRECPYLDTISRQVSNCAWLLLHASPRSSTMHHPRWLQPAMPSLLYSPPQAPKRPT